jgi:glycosyltransferase involved in cell wall biosynthesis
MGCGIPPIATDTAGTAEVVEDGRNGYVVPVEDPGAIADRVRHLYENPKLVASMSAECVKTIDNEMSVRIAIDRYIDFFEALLAG